VGGESSLKMQVNKYLSSKKLDNEDPLEFIKDECSKRVKRAEGLGHAYIIMGDLNQSWERKEKSDSSIKDWAKENNLTSSRQSGEIYGYRHTRYVNVHKREGGTEIDHILTNYKLINLQEKDGYDDNHEHDMLSDHIMQMILINIPLMPRIRRPKEKKKIREIIDIKITKDKYVEGEEIRYTGKALKWQKK
jgi:hypothetical protein